MENKKFSEWHGIEREKINWHPEVDENKCIGCGFCVTTCGRGVYKYDYEKKKSNVVNPKNCMVACQTCANLCPATAIHFAEDNATREKAQEIIKEFEILPQIKIELEKRKHELEFVERPE